MFKIINTVAAAGVVLTTCPAMARTAEQFRVRLLVVEACTVRQESALDVVCALGSPYRLQAVQSNPGVAAGNVTLLEVFF
ncbi:hypothetical protein [Cupriavidus alkaliphilus]|uniref:hypothetical protein n=1 Tax=Cupriavidus alkaliphilus TaxID=942866 RepID=UPI00339D9E9C